MSYLLQPSDSTAEPIEITPREANTSSTSLTFIGKGYRSYGDEIQLNLLRLLENFASHDAPVNPIIGQLWYNKAVNQLKVWDNENWLGIADNITNANTEAPSVQTLGQLWYDLTTLDLKVWNGTEWVKIADAAALSMHDELVTLINEVAVIPKVSKTGDVMTGPLTLSSDPLGNLHASTKQYVDGKLALTGGTLSGPLLLSGDPTLNLQAATKQYTDTRVLKTGDAMSGPLQVTSLSSPNYSQLGNYYLSLAAGGAGGTPLINFYTSGNQVFDARIIASGGNASTSGEGVLTFNGNVFLDRHPTANLMAATKQYVDTSVSASALGFTPVQQGGGISQASNKVYIGWSAGAQLRVQVDSTDFGGNWPINITGTAVLASHATSADTALNATNSTNAVNATNSVNAVLASKASAIAQGGGNGNGMVFNWSGLNGQPSWIWGGNDGVNMYVYNPANFNVNHATYADGAPGNFTVPNGTSYLSNTAVAGTLTVSGLSYLNGNVVINNTSPTIYLQDTDSRSAMLHLNTDTLHVLRGAGNNTTGWAVNPVTGKWPMMLNVDTGSVSFGGSGNFADHLWVGSGNGSGNGNPAVYFKDGSKYLVHDSTNFVFTGGHIYGPGVGGDNRLAYVQDVKNYADNPAPSMLNIEWGYKRLPGNFMIQWLSFNPGAITVNQPYYFTWPTAFASILSANLSGTIGNASGNATSEGASIHHMYSTGGEIFVSWNSWPNSSTIDLSAKFIIWGYGTW